MSCKRPVGTYCPQGVCPQLLGICNKCCYWGIDPIDTHQTSTGYYMCPSKTLDHYTIDELLEEIKKRVK